MVDRAYPPYVADERQMLDSWLEFHRATLALKCEGLTPEQLVKQSAPPSNLSLLGLVRHMAEVERNWFRRCLADEHVKGIYYTDADDAAGAEADFATWRDECDRARANAAACESLDQLGRRKRRGEGVTLRWIMVHMIEEYARHNGHADLIRERIDGAVGE